MDQALFSDNRQLSRRIAVIPGSFDPVTLGHYDLIERTAALFDTVYAVIFENSAKKTLLSGEERLRLLNKATAALPNVICELSSDMLVRYALEKGACALVKGVRNGTDFDYEYQLSLINRAFDSRVETILLPAKAEYQHLSSTVVREVIKYGFDPRGFVPDSIYEDICSLSTK